MKACLVQWFKAFCYWKERRTRASLLFLTMIIMRLVWMNCHDVSSRGETYCSGRYICSRNHICTGKPSGSHGCSSHEWQKSAWRWTPFHSSCNGTSCPPPSCAFSSCAAQSFWTCHHKHCRLILLYRRFSGGSSDDKHSLKRDCILDTGLILTRAPFSCGRSMSSDSLLWNHTGRRQWIEGESLCESQEVLSF